MQRLQLRISAGFIVRAVSESAVCGAFVLTVLSVRTVRTVRQTVSIVSLLLLVLQDFFDRLTILTVFCRLFLGLAFAGGVDPYALLPQLLTLVGVHLPGGVSLYEPV